MTDQTRRIGEDITKRVNEEEMATRHIDAEEYANQTSSLPLGVLAAGTVICGEYTVIKTVFPQESTRPGLYLCSSKTVDVMIKVAAMMFPPRQDLWEKLPQLSHPGIINTYNVIQQDEYYYEIQEYCNGGTLADRVPIVGEKSAETSPEWIMTVMMPQINEALKYLHGQGIIHRDIKPANIYIQIENGKERMVLGDFDISSVMEGSKTSRDTQRMAGTWIYTAPEAFPRYVDDNASGKVGRISRACDYYSLGITIIELLSGSTSLHQSKLPDLFDFYLQGGAVEVPAGLPGKLTMLLRGLLIRNRRTRWSTEEVDRWLNDCNNEADMMKIANDQSYQLAQANRPYKINNKIVVDLPGLADLMFDEQDAAIEDIITSEVLINWIAAIDTDIARNIRRYRDSNYTEPMSVYYYSIISCDPARPFVFYDGYEAANEDEWIICAHKFAIKNKIVNSLCTEELLIYFEMWLRLKERPNVEMADKVAKLKDTPLETRLEELTYMIQQNRPFTIMRGVFAATPADLVKMVYANKDLWKGKSRPVVYDMAMSRWKDGALCAWLRQRGLEKLAQQIDVIKEELKDNVLAAFEKILRLLEPDLPMVKVTFLQSDPISVYSIKSGEEKTISIRYSTVGCGVPFGAVNIINEAPGVHISNNIINQRSGTFDITIDSNFDQKSQVVNEFKLDIESGISELVSSPFILKYRILFPFTVTLKRLLTGFVIGFAFFAITRALLMMVTKSSLLTRTVINYDGLWGDIITFKLPLIGYIGIFIAFAFFIYIGLKMWFRFMRRSEV
ncbi:MAG: protein kinase [bacterium]